MQGVARAAEGRADGRGADVTFHLGARAEICAPFKIPASTTFYSLPLRPPTKTQEPLCRPPPPASPACPFGKQRLPASIWQRGAPPGARAGLCQPPASPGAPTLSAQRTGRAANSGAAAKRSASPEPPLNTRPAPPPPLQGRRAHLRRRWCAGFTPPPRPEAAADSNCHCLPRARKLTPLLSLRAGARRSLAVRAFKVEEAREQLKDSYAETASSATETAQELADKAVAFWEESEQKPTLVAIGAGALVALYLVDAVVSAVSRVPVLSTTMELVGLGFSAFTAYRWFFVAGEQKAIVGEVKGFAAKVGLDL